MSPVVRFVTRTIRRRMSERNLRIGDVAAMTGLTTQAVRGAIYVRTFKVATIDQIASALEINWEAFDARR